MRTLINSESKPINFRLFSNMNPVFKIVLLTLLIACSNAVNAQEFSSIFKGPLESQTPSTNVIVPSMESDSVESLSLSGGMTPMALLSGGGPGEDGSPAIQDLARGLENDPVRIYGYVKNHIKYQHYFGLRKGAHLTLLEGSGNDFDQCVLLVSLLEAAGVSPSDLTYQFGLAKVPYTNGINFSFENWVGTCLEATSYPSQVNTNDTKEMVFFANKAGEYPDFDTGSGEMYGLRLTSDLNVYCIPRVWLKYVAGGQTYYLDPAYKPKQRIQPLWSLYPSDTPYNGGGSTISTLLSDVATGTGITITTQRVQNLNITKLYQNLTNIYDSMAGTLSNAANANLSVAEVIGDRATIEQEVTALPTSLAFTVQSSSFQPVGFSSAITVPLTDLSSIPTQYIARINFSDPGGTFSYDTTIPKLNGAKLSLKFVSGTPSLCTNDVAVVSGSSGSGDLSVRVVLHMPLGVWDYSNNTITVATGDDYDETLTYVRTNNYAFIYGFGGDRGKLLNGRLDNLNDLMAQGYANTSAEVLSESLNILGQRFLEQTYLCGQIVSGQTGVEPAVISKFGRVFQGNGFVLDMRLGRLGSYKFDYNPYVNFHHSIRYVRCWTALCSALEHSVIEQANRIAGGSTAQGLSIACTTGENIYWVNTNNWQTGINLKSTLLTKFTTDEVAAMSTLIAKGYTLGVPDGYQMNGTWQGIGYLAVIDDGSVIAVNSLITPGYGGANSGINQTVDSQEMVDDYIEEPDPNTDNPTAADPVDMATGAFLIEHNDLSVGLAAPNGLSFTRYAKSTALNKSTMMSPGWTHSYDLHADRRIDAALQLGRGSPQQMLAALAGTLTIVALDYNSTPGDLEKWVLKNCVAKWVSNSLTNDVIAVNIGKEGHQFVQALHGSLFISPPGEDLTLELQRDAKWWFQKRLGNRVVFDPSNGQALYIYDPYGQKATFSYSSGLLDTVTDAFGRQMSFVYTNTTHLWQVIDQTASEVFSGGSSSRKVIFTYGTTGTNTVADIIAVRDPEGKTNKYVYDSKHRILATLDALGQTITTNVFDSKNRVIDQWSEGNTNKHWTLYYSGYETVEKDPIGSRRVFYFDDFSRDLGVKDQLGNRSYNYYNGQNLLIRSISPEGRSTSNSFGARLLLLKSYPAKLATETEAGRRYQAFQYDEFDRMTNSADYAGVQTKYLYSTNGSLPKPLAIISPDIDDVYGWGVTNYFHYETNGFLMWSVDPNNRTNCFTNYVNGAVGKTIFANGDTVTYDYYTRGGLKMLTDSKRKRQFRYNERRDLVEMQDQPVSGGSWVSKETRAYDDNGLLSTQTDERGFTTTFQYSPTRRLVRTISPPLLTGGQSLTNTTVYDNRDWVAATINPLGQSNQVRYLANGLATQKEDALHRISTNQFTADGLLTSVQTPLSAALQFATNFYDMGGRKTTVHDPIGDVSFTFDINDRATAITNRLGKVFKNTYYQDGRLNNVITPLGKIKTNLYNLDGTLWTIHEPSGDTTTFDYDGRNMTTKADGIDGFYMPSTLTYDQNQNLLVRTEHFASIQRSYDYENRVTAYTNSAGDVIRYFYTGGLLSELAYPESGGVYTGTKSILYSYDSHGHLTNLVDWMQRTTSFSYDGAGRLTQVVRFNGSKRTLQYDAGGQLTNISETLPNGLPVAYIARQFDDGGRVKNELIAPTPTAYTESTHTVSVNDDNQLTGFDGVTVMHDADGNMTSGPLGSSMGVAYHYDERNRLRAVGGFARISSATFGSSGSYAVIGGTGNGYGPVNLMSGTTPLVTNVTLNGASARNNYTGWVGYRFRVGDSALTVNKLGRWVISGNSQTHTVKLVDITGADVSGGSVTVATSGATAGAFAYTTLSSPVTLAANSYYFLLTQETSGGDQWYDYPAILGCQGTTYDYDIEGNRTTMVQNGQVTKFTVNPHAGLPQILSKEVNGNKTYYIYGMGLLYEMDESGTALIYHYDARGSTIATTDTMGMVHDRVEYSIYGQITARNGFSDLLFLYNGRYGVCTDPNGLYLMQARYYNPYIRRFINADPSGFGGGLNWYAFADGNPLLLIDPFGLGAASDNDSPEIAAARAALRAFMANSDAQGRTFLQKIAYSIAVPIAIVAAGAAIVTDEIEKAVTRPGSADESNPLGVILFLLLPEKAAADAAPRVVNAETIRTALQDATIKTTQDAVSIPAVERYVRMLESGSSAPPIKVDNGVIVDGNHTYTAGRVFGVEPPQIPGVLSPSQISEIKPIQEIKLDPTDWGNH